MVELQEGTHSLMATVRDAGERVQRTRAEAQELLKWVRDRWSRLEGACLGHGGWGRGQVGVRWCPGRIHLVMRAGSKFRKGGQM